MALTYVYVNREVYASRSWQATPGGYDNTVYNTVFRKTIATDFQTSFSPRDFNFNLVLRENPFLLKKVFMERGAVGVSLANASLKRYSTTSDYSPAVLSQPNWSDHERALYYDAWRATISDVQEVKANLGQLIAERQQLVNSLVSVMTRTHKFITYMKRGDFRRALGQIGLQRGKDGGPRHFARESSQLYLEFQLAILPAAKDIYGLANKALRPPTIRASRSRTYNGTYLYEASGNNGTHIMDTEYNTRINAFAKASIPRAALLAGNIAQQLGLVNPVALAWELVPLSFVVNWFVGIGQFLNQFDAFVGLQIEELSTTTTRRQALIGYQYRLSNSQPGFPRSECKAWIRKRPTGHYVEKIRVLEAKVPLVPPRVPLLDGLSVGKLTTLTALLTQFKLR